MIFAKNQVQARKNWLITNGGIQSKENKAPVVIEEEEEEEEKSEK